MAKAKVEIMNDVLDILAKHGIVKPPQMPSRRKPKLDVMFAEVAKRGGACNVEHDGEGFAAMVSLPGTSNFDAAEEDPTVAMAVALSQALKALPRQSRFD
jgi:hypothetical protein